MKTYLQNNNSDNLILFFCGWGMDENPFSILKNTSDVLYVYDYTVPECEDFFNFDFSKYKSVKLLAFSYGVYASGIAKLPENLKLDFSVAIRVDAPIYVTANVLANGSVSCDAAKDEEEAQEFRDFIQSIKPSDFEKLLKHDKESDQ